MKENNAILIKSKAFAFRIIKMYQYLTDTKKEYVMSKQVYRSGTSIGANVKESINAQSNADFINKLSIALKEADETEYWLDLLHEAHYITDIEFDSIKKDCIELIKLLTSIINSSKKKYNKN